MLNKYDEMEENLLIERDRQMSVLVIFDKIVSTTFYACVSMYKILIVFAMC